MHLHCPQVVCFPCFGLGSPCSDTAPSGSPKTHPSMASTGVEFLQPFLQATFLFLASSADAHQEKHEGNLKRPADGEESPETKRAAVEHNDKPGPFSKLFLFSFPSPKSRSWLAEDEKEATEKKGGEADKSQSSASIGARRVRAV